MKCQHKHALSFSNPLEKEKNWLVMWPSTKLLKLMHVFTYELWPYLRENGLKVWPNSLINSRKTSLNIYYYFFVVKSNR